MSVPNSIADLSVTPSSNAPAGSEALSGADDFLRTLAAFIRQMVSSGSDIASATTITPDAVASSYNVTGTTPITTIASTNSWNGRLILLRFAGALTFTHGSNLNLPGAANITTAAGDVALVRQRTSGTWDCVIYQKASGIPVIAPAVTLTQLNANWSFDAGNRLVNGGGTQPSFYASDSGATSSTSPAVELANYTEAADIGSNFNETTGRWTAPVACTVIFSFAGNFVATAAGSGSSGVTLRKNGQAGSVPGATVSVAGQVTTTIGMSIPVTLAEDDYVSLWGISSSASNSVNASSFSGVMVF